MEPDQKRIVLSYREGCSGSWLGEVLHVCRHKDNFTALYRQDSRGVPASVYHYGGHRDEVKGVRAIYNGQPVITCHVDQPQILQTCWPDAVIYRIIPETYVLDAIAASWYKLPPYQSPATVDQALEYIKNYYRLHTELDPRFGHVIDYGLLRDCEWVRAFVESNGIIYDSRCNEFVEQYWSMQKKTNLKTIPPNISHANIAALFDMPRDNFTVALSIFVFEKSNNLKEEQRCWTIDDVCLQSDLTALVYRN